MYAFLICFGVEEVEQLLVGAKPVFSQTPYCCLANFIASKAFASGILGEGSRALGHEWCRCELREREDGLHAKKIDGWIVDGIAEQLQSAGAPEPGQRCGGL